MLELGVTFRYLNFLSYIFHVYFFYTVFWVVFFQIPLLFTNFPFQLCLICFIVYSPSFKFYVLNILFLNILFGYFFKSSWSFFSVFSLIYICSPLFYSLNTWNILLCCLIIPTPKIFLDLCYMLFPLALTDDLGPYVFFDSWLWTHVLWKFFCGNPFRPEAKEIFLRDLLLLLWGSWRTSIPGPP